MRRFWPHDRRFASDRFGFQPTWLILQALQAGAKLHSEELHLGELGIATLTAYFVNANKGKGEPAKPSDFYRFSPKDAEVRIEPAACDAFFGLVADEKMPSWVVALAPIDRLRAQRANGNVPHPRAWLARQALLLLPRITDGKVHSSLAVVDGIGGSVTFRDSDSGQEYRATIPNAKGEIFWQQDVQFDLEAA